MQENCVKEGIISEENPFRWGCWGKAKQYDP